MEHVVNEKQLEEIVDIVNCCFKDTPFELYPLKVGWYNSLVKSNNLKLDLLDESLAFVVVKKPNIFDEILKKFKSNTYNYPMKDPIDCGSKLMLMELISKLKSKLFHIFSLENLQIRHYSDRDMHPITMLPYVHCQTAGHAAGATFYYRCENDQEYDRISQCREEWCGSEKNNSTKYNNTSQKISGVSLHPIYGGWFSFGGVVCFCNVVVDDNKDFFRYTPPKDTLPNSNDQSQRLRLLHLFTYHWNNNEYRNMNSPKIKYSKEAMDFFSNPHNDREKIFEQLLFNANSQ